MTCALFLIRKIVLPFVMCTSICFTAVLFVIIFLSMNVCVLQMFIIISLFQTNNHVSKQNPGKSGKRAFMTRQRPLYFNCQLLAPDGECLTLCDIRKAEWYISKGLGGRRLVPGARHNEQLCNCQSWSFITVHGQSNGLGLYCQVTI